MAFAISISEDRAEQILALVNFCYEKGIDFDLSFLLEKIAVQFPDLWHLYDLQELLD